MLTLSALQVSVINLQPIGYNIQIIFWDGNVKFIDIELVLMNKIIRLNDIKTSKLRGSNACLKHRSFIIVDVVLCSSISMCFESQDLWLQCFYDEHKEGKLYK